MSEGGLERGGVLGLLGFFWSSVLGYVTDVDVVGTLGIASWYRLLEGSLGRLFLSLSLCVIVNDVLWHPHSLISTVLVDV